MTSALRPLAAALFAFALGFGLPSAASAQSFSPDQRGEIEKIIREYLMSHPELLQDVIAEMEKKQAVVAEEKSRAAITENREAIFNSPRQVVLGNLQGDVTMVEFFDYNCGYCKRAVSDMMDLIKADPKLRIVLKEFPVLGEGSTHAAQVAVAVRMQDKTGGKKYLDFHQKLFNSRGQVDKARALAVAKEVGMDMSRLDKDMASEEVKTTLAESFKLAEAMGINGTPSYVVGTDMLMGAVGVDAIREKINKTRCGNATC
jgi:protein-disulfide isomerase